LAIRKWAAIAVAFLAACSQSSPRVKPAPSPAIVSHSPPAPVPAAELVLSTAPWTLDADPGTVITTANYKIFTTSTKTSIVENIPPFMESAIAHYTSALGELPHPDAAMEIYLLGTRPQWERMTRRLMGEQAETYLRIPKGGFSYDGRAILYDIGRRDTFTITAHEGWHVYTQRTFRNSLPVWLEEGVSTYMEGFRWDTASAERPTFLPWANFERFDQLRWGVRSEKLMSLDALTKSTPQQLIAGDPDAALFYYAQVWGLVQFLNEGENGIYRDKLRRLISDAAHGQLVPRIRKELGDRAASTYTYRRRGVDIVHLYFGKTPEEMEPQFRAFLDTVVKTGTRQQIYQGKSPLAP